MIEELEQFTEATGQIVSTIVAVIGILKLCRWIYHSSSFVKRNFFTKGLDLYQKYDGENSWAVITGGSDGIGQEMARRFAKQGFNIAIISRTLSKLQSFEKELQQLNPKIKTRMIQADFKGNTNVEFYK